MRNFFVPILVFLVVLIGFIFVFVVVNGNDIDLSYAKDSWPPVKYASVKAYVYNLDDPRPDTLPNPNIIEDGKLVSSVVDRKGVELSRAQIQKLIAAISKIPPHYFGITTISASMCIFDPHHAFVFYDSEGTPVATVEICLLCNQVQVSPVRKLEYKHDFTEIDSLFRELNLPVFHTYEEFNAYRKK